MPEIRRFYGIVIKMFHKDHLLRLSPCGSRRSSVPASIEPNGRQPATPIEAERRSDRHRPGARGRDGWLSPVELQPERKAAVATEPGRRASDKGVSAGEPE